MDYFGIIDLEENMFQSGGFFCQTPGCNNKEAKYGNIMLPYCNQNAICCNKNMEHLIAENARQQGEINAYEKMLNTNNFSFFSNKMEVSPKRKREESLRKNTDPSPKRLSTSQ